MSQMLAVTLLREAPLLKLTLEFPRPLHAVLLPALVGPPGSQGIAQISADANNQLVVGTDNRLYVPEPQLASAQW